MSTLSGNIVDKDEDIDILLWRNELITNEKKSELDDLLKNQGEKSLEHVIREFFEFVQSQKKTRKEIPLKED